MKIKCQIIVNKKIQESSKINEDDFNPGNVFYIKNSNIPVAIIQNDKDSLTVMIQAMGSPGIFNVLKSDLIKL